MAGAEMFSTAAVDYDRFVGRYGADLARDLIAFAGVEHGMRVLDVGCGPGALTAALAALVGAQNVSAAEPSEPFAEACRTRVPGARVVAAGAEDLPFPDDRFDATLSQLVVNFIPDPPAGVREMARVTRRGGLVAGCVWDYSCGMTLLRAFWDAAREVVPERAADDDEASVMRFCTEPELAGLWREAGLRDVRSRAILAHARYESFDDLWAPLLSGVGPAGAFCVALPSERQAALREACRRRLGVGGAPFELTARAWAAAGLVA